MAIRLHLWPWDHKERGWQSHRGQCCKLSRLVRQRFGHDYRPDGVGPHSLFNSEQDLTHWNRPCGMNTPHTHPRATEILYLVTGEMEAGFIEENGARFVDNILTKGQGTLFPQGSIHYQINTGCDPVLFVAALNDEDPGTTQISQRCELNSPFLLPYPLIPPCSLRASPGCRSGHPWRHRS